MNHEKHLNFSQKYFTILWVPKSKISDPKFHIIFTLKIFYSFLR